MPSSGTSENRLWSSAKMWQKGCYRARISGTSQTSTWGYNKTTPVLETTLTIPRRGEMLVATRIVVSGYLPSRSSVESSPIFFPSAWSFQLMVEAHRIADPGSGEGVFQSIKHWFKPSPSGRTSLYILHFAYYIFIIFYTTYCRRATTSSKLLVPNFFCCLGGGSRRNCEWAGGGWTPSPLFAHGLFLLSDDWWESEKAFDLFPFWRGVFPPLEESLRRMRTAAAMLLLSQFQFLASGLCPVLHVWRMAWRHASMSKLQNNSRGEERCHVNQKWNFTIIGQKEAFCKW